MDAYIASGHRRSCCPSIWSRLVCKRMSSIFWDWKNNGDLLPWNRLIFCDVSNELWKRINSLLTLWRQYATFAWSILAGMQWVCFSLTIAQKYCPQLLPLWNKASHGSDFSYPSCRLWRKISVDAQWQSMDCPCYKLRYAHKNQHLRISGATPQTEDEEVLLDGG